MPSPRTAGLRGQGCRSGVEWELPRSPRAADELIRGARLCSQRLYQFNLALDGDSQEAASVWLRMINGKLISRMTRTWTGEWARRPGLVQPGSCDQPWQAHLDEVAERRRTRNW